MKRACTCLIVALAAWAVVLIAPAPARAELPNGSSPPAFIGAAGDWINSSPLTWAGLRGKVVLVDFWEYTCVNCIRTYPYLKAWHTRYAPYGLVIVGIHRPEFEFDKSKQLVAEAVKREGFRYPILNDPQYRNWSAYHEHTWPSKYIFDQSGKLVEQHQGEGDYQETELLIQKLLRRTHPSAEFPKLLPPVRPGDRPDVVCQQETPEQYTNPHPEYHSLGNLPRGWRVNGVAQFAAPTRRLEGKIYANGSFVTRYQSLQHGRATTDLRDSISLRYRASEVDVVVNRPSGKDYRVYAFLDGKPIPKSTKGDDLKCDARGSYLQVDFARMYNVIRGPFAAHELRLSSDSPEFELYSYTFSGCPQK